MKRLCALFGACCLLFVPAQVGAQCGQERWSVKTGTDAGVFQVDLATTATARKFDVEAPKLFSAEPHRCLLHHGLMGAPP